MESQFWPARSPRSRLASGALWTVGGPLADPQIPGGEDHILAAPARCHRMERPWWVTAGFRVTSGRLTG
jgi:hypothetical protein